MKTYVASIDSGTSAIKTALFDMEGNIKGLVIKKCPCIFHKNGFIEQDPRGILGGVFSSLKKTVEMSGVRPIQVAAISFSSQRATVIPVDRNGVNIGNAISWQDMRGAKEIKKLKKTIDDSRYYQITGLPDNPVFTLGKILWFKKDSPGTYKKIWKFALVNDYISRSAGLDDLYADWSNASLTGMFDISGFSWSEEILKLTGISRDKLPLLVSPGKKTGALNAALARKCGLLPGTPLISGGGDQQCAGLGAGAVEPGVAEITLGTAAVTLLYSDKRAVDPGRRIMCAAHAVPGKWEVEGLQNSAAGSLAWISRIVNNGKDFNKKFFSKMEKEKRNIPGKTILFYPFLSGSSAPNWISGASAVLLGLGHAHDKHDIVRSIMEGVTLETREILDVFGSLGIPLEELRITGGGSTIESWMRMQANIFNKKLTGLECHQASLLGAGMLAAYGIGAFKDLKAAARKMVRVSGTYLPDAEKAVNYNRVYEKYKKIQKTLRAAGVFGEL
ncbi:MAG: xylulose kinase [Candidatus Omnitrophica bacterium]|nr:xylulose kinase [Candidatus Omnitrophota bacterium]